MLLELAAANAAFSVIKEAVQNGGDLLAVGQSVFSFFDSKAAIQKKARDGGFKSDAEEFLALEKIKQSEAEITQLFIYLGRPGLHDEWLQFQVDARVRREEEERAVIRKQVAFRRKVETVAVYVAVGFIAIIVGILITTFIIIAST